MRILISILTRSDQVETRTDCAPTATNFRPHPQAPSPLLFSIMDTLDGSSWDVLLAGTGIQQSLLALYVSSDMPFQTINF